MARASTRVLTLTRGSRTRLEYLVKWEGYTNPTWEPATALEGNDALAAYREQQGGG
jgi:hypothetical protein